jgi:hypothetical protein
MLQYLFVSHITLFLTVLHDAYLTQKITVMK